MKAMVVDGPGGVDVLQYRDVPDPVAAVQRHSQQVADNKLNDGT